MKMRSRISGSFQALRSRYNVEQALTGFSPWVSADRSVVNLSAVQRKGSSVASRLLLLPRSSKVFHDMKLEQNYALRNLGFIPCAA